MHRTRRSATAKLGGLPVLRIGCVLAVLQSGSLALGPDPPFLKRLPVAHPHYSAPRHLARGAERQRGVQPSVEVDVHVGAVRIGGNAGNCNKERNRSHLDTEYSSANKIKAGQLHVNSMVPRTLRPVWPEWKRKLATAAR